MSLSLFCPKKRNQKSFLVCIYSCPKNTKKNCLEYKLHFEAICSEKVDQLYIDKYGEPEYTKPIVPRKREVRSINKEKQDDSKRTNRRTGKTATKLRGNSTKGR